MSSFFRTVSDSDSESSSEEELLSGSEAGSDSGLESKQQKAKASGSGAAAPKKNRFLRGGSSDSDSDDDDSDSDESSDEEDLDASDDEDGKKAARASRFLKGAESETDSSEDEGKRVVKSAKSKRQEEVDASVRIMDNAAKINDWHTISNEFDKLTRLVQRQANVAEPVPLGYLKVLGTLEESLAAANANAAAKKKMNATNARALNTMKQKLRKAVRDNEAIVTKYRADPEAYEKELEEAALAAQEPKKKPVKKVVADGEPIDDADFTTVGKGGKQFTFSADSIFKTLQAVLELRGRKNTDRAEQVRILEKLLSICTTTYQKVRVLLALVSLQFDYNPGAVSHMTAEGWRSARTRLDELLALLSEETDYIVREDTADYDDQEERAPESGKKLEIRGSITSLLDRLDDEFTKALQNTDPHTAEYIERLRDEKPLYDTIVRSQCYFELAGLTEAMGKSVMRRLEHVYCKPDAVISSLEADLPKVESSVYSTPATTSSTPYSSEALIHALCVHLYKTDASLLRTRAMLCHIYNQALHDQYHRARDMMLMSHLQETVHGADVATQILYNRTVVQLGLCAFRLGLIRECQSTLQEIFASQRVKELLAQGVQGQRFSQLTPEQEKLEKQRQLPFHMHINPELLECTYLVSSMLLEVPNMAQAGNDPELRKRQISRTFRRMFDYSDRQVFTGPPENKRDHIMQAARALQTGDWQKCAELINAIKIWNLLPKPEAIKSMLTRQIQEEGLRTYLFTYSAYYANISISYLASTFELEESTVTSIVSKMIWNDELVGASLDQISGTVVLQKSELSKLQQLAVTLIDKTAVMCDSNDRYLEAKLGEGRGDRERRGEAKEGGEGGQRGPRRGGLRGGYRGRGRGQGFQGGPIGRSVAVGGARRT